MPGQVRQDVKQDFAIIRRFEAAGLRAWPAETVAYDGTWVLRLTAGHPAKRLNSINPLDPGDHRNLEERIARAAEQFKAYGRPLTFRLSPLAAPEISTYLDEQGWSTLGRSLVMALDLREADLTEAMDQIPLKDRRRFVNATLKVHGYEELHRAGLSRVIGAIRPETGLFVLEEGEEPVATAICVHDSDLAGLFEIATRPSWRGKGYGRRVLLSALKWAQSHGAERAWLQVEADNEVAVGLYKAMGFREIYSYHYRQPQEAVGTEHAE
ncbi:GNAT family N-acetyltransferase [Nitratireductor aquimarinus]|uniref:GNAT family N-acetyltransferase n=1 Tax=Alphaproteobacteria TaxID=28211 RepID=UPI000DDDD5A7|nr:MULTISPECIES: GNAT family N-acetyltransferase [Alphaproteobacteria]MBN7762176.1 GNAT family N-acetyltransferase [Nitratireductor aquibiodomus]MBN7778101.1 GNAT family N-acetyltransferase [Nitratireductor pacificus]MBY6022502.1 GNAT family N-acetyltransferase [Nitratireductor sp. DP7N14-4]MBN7757711.1 GNAT family N-acetyltransferase [Nitratireductor aquimarinus]MBN7782423.1 GNAT family N-acetyltransferase [Nitratireductor pacificus]